jgi:hypothetical protein
LFYFFKILKEFIYSYIKIGGTKSGLARETLLSYFSRPNSVQKQNDSAVKDGVDVDVEEEEEEIEGFLSFKSTKVLNG